MVKHKVYLPTWSEAERADYTRVLIELQHRLLPAGLEGTISTLPIAWGQPRPAEDDLGTAAAHLFAVARNCAPGTGNGPADLALPGAGARLCVPACADVWTFSRRICCRAAMNAWCAAIWRLS